MRPQGTAYGSARDALTARRQGQVAIRQGSRHLVMSVAEADHLAENGASFGYICERQGRILIVPVN